MGRDGEEIELEGEPAALYQSMRGVIDRQNDGMALMTMVQDMVGELLRRECDAMLRERTLGEVSRFFLTIIKASDLSSQYKINRLRSFARATVKLLLHRRAAAADAGPASYDGPDRRSAMSPA